jgi:hypothetical protein
MVATIDYRDIGITMSQCLGSRNTGEATTDDHDSRFCRHIHHSLL